MHGEGGGGRRGRAVERGREEGGCSGERFLLLHTRAPTPRATRFPHHHTPPGGRDPGWTGGGGVNAAGWARAATRPPASPATTSRWCARTAAARPANISLHTLTGPADAPAVRTVATLAAPGVSASGGDGRGDATAAGVWALEFDAFGTWLAASLAGVVVSAADAAAATAPLPPPPRVCLWRPTLAGAWELQGEVVAGEVVAGG